MIMFCFAVAFTAAALAGALVECLSDMGAFGAAPYTDGSIADMVPGLAVGLILATGFVWAVATRMVTPGARPPAWLRRAADITHLGAVQLLLTLGLQIAILFVMETCEQIALWGHPLGGTIWIGGPIAVSFMLHAIVCLTVAALFLRSLRWLAARVAVVLSLIKYLLIDLAHPQATDRSTFEIIVLPAVRARRRQHGRAPPLQPLLM
jgi:hypothetical protein